MGTNLDLRRRRWHPAKNSGGAPYRQLCPAYPSADYRSALYRNSSSPRDRAKGSAGTFQRGKFPEATSVQLQTGNALLKSSAANSHTIPRTRSIHQAWIDSRNQTTIATRLKHRQLIFLHPSCRKRSKKVQPASANLVSGSWRALAAPAC